MCLYINSSSFRDMSFWREVNNEMKCGKDPQWCALVAASLIEDPQTPHTDQRLDNII